MESLTPFLVISFLVVYGLALLAVVLAIAAAVLWFIKLDGSRTTFAVGVLSLSLSAAVMLMLAVGVDGHEPLLAGVLVAVLVLAGTGQLASAWRRPSSYPFALACCLMAGATVIRPAFENALHTSLRAQLVSGLGLLLAGTCHLVAFTPLRLPRTTASSGRSGV